VLEDVCPTIPLGHSVQRITIGPPRLPDYEGAKAYALERLTRDLPSFLQYHTLWHTQDEIVPRTEWLSRHEGLSREAAVLVGTAAHFHDIGFVTTCVEHEDASARIVADVLPHFGYRLDQIHTIQRIIYATRLPQSARTLLERIMADADLDVLGRDDYLERNAALRAEKTALGTTYGDQAWYPDQLLFLQRHQYFTQIAATQRGPGKRRNLRQMQAIVADCCPDSLRVQAALPVASTATP